MERQRSCEAILAEVAKETGLTPSEYQRRLFADIPMERSIPVPDPPLTARKLALQTNLKMAQSFLARSLSIQIKLRGNARAVVRHAKFRGLICLLERADESGAFLSLSGPFALFRRSLLYGRALGELLPLLAWTATYELWADCRIQGKRRRLYLKTGEPLPANAPPKKYDSKLERKFVRDFQKQSSNWDLIREPEPVAANGTLIFPDFLLKHRFNPEERWLIEVMGFWTPQYLEKKLRHLREAGLSRMILCLDESLNCSQEDLPEGVQILPFKRRIPCERLLELIECSE